MIKVDHTTNGFEYIIFLTLRERNSLESIWVRFKPFGRSYSILLPIRKILLELKYISKNIMDIVENSNGINGYE